MSYRIKTDVFEGPFDLLVYLIEHAQMSIYDIRIAQITDQYMAHIENMRGFSVEAAGEFMVLAATLIEIKSKMLLPRYTPDGGGAFTEEDPRVELVERILEYKRFKAASEMLEQSEAYARLSVCKPQEDLAQYVKTDEEYPDLSISQFVKAFNMFLIKKKRVEDIHKRYGEVERERVSIGDKLARLDRLLVRKVSFSFEDMLDDPEDRQEIIASFMAVLEFLRRREIAVRQLVSFGRIYIERAARDTRAAVAAPSGATSAGSAALLGKEPSLVQ